MENPDQLRELFRMQKALNERIGVKTDGMSEEEKTKWMLNYTRAMQQEMAELTDSVPWKWWAKYQKFDEQNARVEVVDLFHFLISMAQVLGMSADDVFAAYVKKNEVNFKRQDTGYATKITTTPSTFEFVNAKSKSPVPPRWRREIESILITDEQMARRVKTLAREIERDFRGHEMVVVSLLNGTVLFLADLIRQLNLPLRLDFIGVSSYGDGTESGELVFTKELRIDVRGPRCVAGGRYSRYRQNVEPRHSQIAARLNHAVLRPACCWTSRPAHGKSKGGLRRF